MRISDWSSDVCSSDLASLRSVGGGLAARTLEMKTPRKRGAYFTGLPTQQLFGPFNKVFDGKAEVLEHGAGGCRFAEGIDANDIAIKADERSPVVADPSLDGDALAQFRRQHGVAVAGG